MVQNRVKAEDLVQLTPCVKSDSFTRFAVRGATITVHLEPVGGAPRGRGPHVPRFAVDLVGEWYPPTDSPILNYII